MWLSERRPNYLLWGLLGLSLLLHLGFLLKLCGLFTPHRWVYLPVKLTSFRPPRASVPLPSPPRLASRVPVPTKAPTLPEIPEEALPTGATPTPPVPIPTRALETPKVAAASPSVNPQEILNEWQAAQGRFKSYAALVRTRIEQAKHYPLAAREMGIQGVTTLRFVLSGNGELLEAEILRSSGSKILDKAALRAVREAAPFPKPPYPFDQRRKLCFVVSLSFHLE